MATVKQSVRQNQVLMVIQHSNEGMSIVKACKEVGLSRSAFYRFCSKYPDMIATFQEMQLAAGMQQLALILDNQIAILERVIQDALAETTKPRQALAIYKFLVKRADDLMESLHVEGITDQEIEELLSGPELVQAKSRFSASEKEIPITGDTHFTALTAGS